MEAKKAKGKEAVEFVIQKKKNEQARERERKREREKKTLTSKSPPTSPNFERGSKVHREAGSSP